MKLLNRSIRRMLIWTVWLVVLLCPLAEAAPAVQTFAEVIHSGSEVSSPVLTKSRKRLVCGRGGTMSRCLTRSDEHGIHPCTQCSTGGIHMTNMDRIHHSAKDTDIHRQTSLRLFKASIAHFREKFNEIAFA